MALKFIRGRFRADLTAEELCAVRLGLMRLKSHAEAERAAWERIGAEVPELKAKAEAGALAEREWAEAADSLLERLNP